MLGKKRETDPNNHSSGALVFNAEKHMHHVITRYDLKVLTMKKQ